MIGSLDSKKLKEVKIPEVRMIQAEEIAKLRLEYTWHVQERVRKLL